MSFLTGLDLKVFLLIMGSYASAVVVSVVLWAMYRSPRGQRYLISDDPHRSTSDRDLVAKIVLNAIVSVILIFSVVYGFADYLYYDRSVATWRILLEIATVLMVYDFAYYFVHRYPFHEWKMLRRVHAVHHAAKNPRYVDSLLLHPVETVLGLGLFFGSCALVGGVHVHVMGGLFIVYTAFNVLNHAGVSVPHFPFKWLGVLAEKHDRHHHSMLSGNYASITPLPDIIFGTVE